eukprot:7394900-Prorocentrum_lima.AAC.1
MSLELSDAIETTCVEIQLFAPANIRHVVIGVDANAGLVPTDFEDGPAAWATSKCGGDPNNERDVQFSTWLCYMGLIPANGLEIASGT